MYVMARAPALDEAELRGLLDKARRLGHDMSKVELVLALTQALALALALTLALVLSLTLTRSSSSRMAARRLPSSTST